MVRVRDRVVVGVGDFPRVGCNAGRLIGAARRLEAFSNFVG